MEAVKTDVCNHNLGAPPGHEDTTGTLPVHVERHEEYLGAYRSFWRPTPEEIGELARGGYLRLSIFGTAHPPVALDVVSEDYPQSVIPPGCEVAVDRCAECGLKPDERPEANDCPACSTSTEIKVSRPDPKPEPDDGKTYG